MEKEVHDLLRQVATDGYAVVMRPVGGSVHVIDISNGLPAEIRGELLAYCDPANSPDACDCGIGRQATRVDLYHRLAHVTGAELHAAGVDAPLAAADLKAAILVLAETTNIGTPFTLGTKEVAYLKKVAEGMNDAEIADDLGLSLRAVKERKRHVQRDLEANSIAHAVAIAHAHQII